MQPYVGRKFENKVEAVLDKGGFWNTLVTITESVTLDGENWKDAEISSKGIDRDFDMAHQTALRACLQYLESEVYSRGFSSLVEAQLEESTDEDGAEANDNETAAS